MNKLCGSAAALWFFISSASSSANPSLIQASEPRYDSGTYCTGGMFDIELSQPSAVIDCTLPYDGVTGIKIQTSCGQLPLTNCTLNVYYANGTSPNDTIGGVDDTFLTENFGPCPFLTLFPPFNQTCPPGTPDSIYPTHYHALTTSYLQVNHTSLDIYLMPHSYDLVPPFPLPGPFGYVLSPNDEHNLINQYYSVQCIDSAGRISNAANFEAIYPFCA